MSLHTSDSLSSYRDSASLYSVGNPSNLKTEDFSKIANEPTLPKDTIEFSKEKIKEEALNSLRNSKKYLIRHPGFLRIGKYVFTAVVFPPYFLFYGLPSWVITEVIPIVFSPLIAMSKFVYSKVKTAIVYIVQKFILFDRWMSQFSMKMLGQVHFLGKFFKRFKEGVLFNKYKEKKKQFEDSVNRNFNLLKEKMCEWVVAKKEELLKAFKAFDDNLSDFFQELIPPIHRMRLSFKEKAFAYYQVAIGITDRIFEKIALKRQVFLFYMKPYFRSLQNFYQKHLKGKWQAFQTRFKEWDKKTDSFLQNTFKKMKNFFKRKQEKISSLSSDEFLERVFHHSFFLFLPSFVKQTLQAFLSRLLVKRVLNIATESLKLFGMVLFRCADEVLTMLGKGLIGLFNCYLKIKKYCGFHIRKCIFLIKKGLENVANVCEKMLYMTLLFLMIVVILMVWGIAALWKNLESLRQTIFFEKATE